MVIPVIIAILGTSAVLGAFSDVDVDALSSQTKALSSRIDETSSGSSAKHAVERPGLHNVFQETVLQVIKEVNDEAGADILKVTFTNEGPVKVNALKAFDEELHANHLAQVLKTLEDNEFKDVVYIPAPAAHELPELDVTELEPAQEETN